MPSGITRNKDGLNDVWGTFPLFVKEYEMKVYNRYGQKIWESTYKRTNGIVSINPTKFPMAFMRGTWFLRVGIKKRTIRLVP